MNSKNGHMPTLLCATYPVAIILSKFSSIGVGESIFCEGVVCQHSFDHNEEGGVVMVETELATTRKSSDGEKSGNGGAQRQRHHQ